MGTPTAISKKKLPSKMSMSISVPRGMFALLFELLFVAHEGSFGLVAEKAAFNDYWQRDGGADGQ